MSMVPVRYSAVDAALIDPPYIWIETVDGIAFYEDQFGRCWMTTESEDLYYDCVYLVGGLKATWLALRALYKDLMRTR